MPAQRTSSNKRWAYSPFSSPALSSKMAGLPGTAGGPGPAAGARARRPAARSGRKYCRVFTRHRPSDFQGIEHGHHVIGKQRKREPPVHAGLAPAGPVGGQKRLCVMAKSVKPPVETPPYLKPVRIRGHAPLRDAKANFKPPLPLSPRTAFATVRTKTEGLATPPAVPLANARQSPLVATEGL